MEGELSYFSMPVFKRKKVEKKSGDYMLKTSSLVEVMVYFHLKMLVNEGRMFKPEKKSYKMTISP